MLPLLPQEITILGSLRHPNVVQLLGGSVSLQSGASFLVEELCGRTLSHAIYDGAFGSPLGGVPRMRPPSLAGCPPLEMPPS